MRRTALAAGLMAFLLVAMAADAQPNLPGLFAQQIKAINRAPRAPDVLLPARLGLDAKHLFAAGGAAGASYDLSLGAVARCGGADACFVADFTAAKARTVFGTPVHVPGASQAGFLPLSCGASCAPPEIDFIWHGVRYTIQARLASSHGDRAALIAAARSAISAGPR